MQENNDKYTYEEIDGKIVSVEEATEIQKKQKKSFRLKIAALCLAVTVGGLAYHKLNDKEEIKTGSDVGAFQIDENNELREVFEQEYERGLEEYNIQRLAEVNTNSKTTYILIEENRIDGNWYSSKPFITNDIPKSDKDKRYIFAGIVGNDDVIIYEKQKRKVTTTDFENYKIESNWESTGEYFYSNEPPVDTIDTRYVIVGYQSNKDEGNYIKKSNLKNSYYPEKSELGTVINIENQNTSEQTLGKVR